jgi:hypothetical protein
MHHATARAIQPQERKERGIRGAVPSLPFEASSRLAKLPGLEAMVISGKAKFVHSKVKDGTCQEKAAICGIGLDQVLSVAFFDVQSKEDAEVGRAPRTYGVVRVASTHLDSKALKAFKEEGKEGLRNISRSQAKRAKSSTPPGSMRAGTCSPFMTEEAASQVSGLVFVSDVHPDTIVDLSIGDTDDTAHEFSVQMRYGDVVDLVRQQYGSRMQIITN